jgi:hypothetical protein
MRRPAGSLAWGALLLGLCLLAFEGGTLILSLLRPHVSPQYAAVFLQNRQICWLSAAEQAAAAADPLLTALPDTVAPAALDHRTLCMLLPDWPPAPHRTADGGVYSRTEKVRIMLPVRAGQSLVTLTLEGYAPPRIAGRVGSSRIEVKPTVDGVPELPVTLRPGRTAQLKLGLPDTGADGRVVTIILEIPQPDWLHALNVSDDPQFVGVVLRRLDRT